MSYSEFTLAKAKRDFDLSTVEGGRFLPIIEPIAPSSYLTQSLDEGLSLAIATGSSKARYPKGMKRFALPELIISPILVEVRKILQKQVSLFSGEDFTVDATLGLSGVCDFLISRSPEQIFIEAPVVVIVEAKKADLKTGLGQCAAEMVAAQKFNQTNNQTIQTIYGSVSSGTAWRFLKLEGQTLFINLHDYSVPPVEPLLGMLVWMVQEH
ncbi:MAG: hypothetical protein H0X31_13450 [Nostocaceae cyanobacterium]|nr:hypothetical protein [Nostocaceae cyanobacterium]